VPISPFGPPYRIVTPVGVVRCLEPSDAPAVQELILGNLEHLRRWVDSMAGEPRPLEARVRELRAWRAAFDNDQSWRWAVLDGDDGALVGIQIINRIPPGDGVDIGALTARNRTRRGLATVSTAALMRACFETMGLTRVQTTTHFENQASIAAMRKLGFTHEATPRHLVAGKRVDEMVWSILADEWPSTPAAAMAADARGYDVLGNRVF
jgi:RimJ/RimL family protein N-acetyltransferase